MISEIQSKGLYSTWLYLSEINTLMDCGEGLASYLKGRCFSIRRILISHDHTDHIAGLDTLINVRNQSGKGQAHPLVIYHPPKIPNLREFKAYITKTQPNLHFPLQWKEISPGQEIPIGVNHKIRAFKAEHGWADALGFSVIESRERLKAKFQHLSGVEIARMRLDAVDTQEAYEKKLLVYSGDALRIPLAEAFEADYLFHDTTFLVPEDREREEKTQEKKEAKKESRPSHAHLDEVLEFIKEAKIKKQAFLHHISPRYKAEDLEIAQAKLPKHCKLIPPGRITKINPHPESKQPQKSVASQPRKPTQKPARPQDELEP